MDHKWSDRLDPSESEERRGDRRGRRRTIGIGRRKAKGDLGEVGKARKWLLSDAKTEEPFQGEEEESSLGR